MRRGFAVAAAAVLLAHASSTSADPPTDRSAPAEPTAPTPAAAPRTASSASLFPRPPEVQARVRFWTRVFSEVESNEGLIHDAKYLDIVYDAVRWPEGLSERVASQRYERAKAQYRTILSRLAERPPSNAEERRVLALFPKGVSAGALRAAADRIRFQRGQADKFRDGLVRSGRWEDHIARVLRERGLPPELSALPHVESSYNPVAYSHAGAAGLWQFMPSTARLHGLRVDRHLDERFDPYRASEGAADLLADNLRMTGAWPLAITAYNHGAGGVLRGVRQLGTSDIGPILERYESPTFGFASRNFYAEFLAAVDVERNAVGHFGRVLREQPEDHEVLVIDGPYSARSLARAFGVDLGLLRETNLALRDPVWKGRSLVPRGYALRLPRVADRPAAAQILASIPKSQPKEVQAHAHVVRRGDTLSRIARRYGVSERTLGAANGIRNPRSLQVGRRLRIPGATEVAVAEDAAARKPPVARPAGAAAKTYTVRRGDTLSSIARRHGVSVQQLVAANGLQRADRIRAGQRLRVPSGAAAVASAADSDG